MMARPCSDELRKKRSEAAKKRWSDPDFKARVAKSVGKASSEMWNRPGFKLKMSIALKGKAAWNKGKKASEELRRKLSESHKGLQVGENHPMFGRKHSEETRRKLSESHQGPRPWRLGFTHTPEVRSQLSKSHKGVPLSERHRDSIGKSSKLAWSAKSKEERDNWVKSCRTGLRCFPNKPESKLLSLLDDMYPGDWKFVGDGEVVLAGKCPDFINVNGQKKIIELFGDYWHRGQNPQDRIDTFRPFGYETLVIWEKELKDIKSVADRIHKFMVT